MKNIRGSHWKKKKKKLWRKKYCFPDRVGVISLNKK